MKIDGIIRDKTYHFLKIVSELGRSLDKNNEQI